VPAFAAVREQFTYYDEQAMRFGYAATEGRPWFITHAENHWQVRALGPNRSVVEAQAELELRLFPAVLLAPLLKLVMRRTGAQFSEELKYFIEHDQAHLRKLKAQQQQVHKAVARW
jgi:hypothetical protein